jgi:hypothetical protein
MLGQRASETMALVEVCRRCQHRKHSTCRASSSTSASRCRRSTCASNCDAATASTRARTCTRASATRTQRPKAIRQICKGCPHEQQDHADWSVNRSTRCGRGWVFGARESPKSAVSRHASAGPALVRPARPPVFWALRLATCVEGFSIDRVDAVQCFKSTQKTP